jgi:heat-inducible transcriptional repressor
VLASEALTTLQKTEYSGRDTASMQDPGLAQSGDKIEAAGSTVSNRSRSNRASETKKSSGRIIDGEGMNLSRREFVVLNGVVEEYIRTGAPVASRQVVRSSSLRLSSATIRNVMAKLEEGGYLARSHASAGCVPTDAGFRLYVDSLEPNRRPPIRVRSELLEQVTANRRELVEDLEWVAQVIADATWEAGMAVRPMDEGPVLEAVSLVDLGAQRVLGVVVTTDGSVEKRVLLRDREPSVGELQQESEFLNRAFRGKSVDAIRRLTAFEDECGVPSRDPVADRATTTARDLFREDVGEFEVQVAGTDRLLESVDFAEAERIRSLLAALQDRRRIVNEWRRALDRGRTQVILGHESEVTASGNLGMVATLFYRRGRPAGALGVVGPRRMDYGRIVPMVQFLGDTLTRLLDEPGASHA